MLSLSFNQSYTCLIVGRSNGFRIFNCSPFSKCFDSANITTNNQTQAIAAADSVSAAPLLSVSSSSSPIGGVYLCEMLFNTSLVALVGSGDSSSDSPRKLRLFNTRTEKTICEVNFVSSILGVRMTLSRLITVHPNKIHIFDLKSMKVLHSLDTPNNPRGVSALSASPASAPSGGSSYLIFPASDSTGELIVYDATNLQIVNSIRAHNTRVRCVAFNRNGNLLATASSQGTVLRVFSIPDGQKLFTFRRGALSALVNSISFNSNSSLIALSSENSSTVHIFSLIHRDSEAAKDKKDSESSLSSGFTSLMNNFSSDSFSFSQLGSALLSSGQQLAASAVSALGTVSQQFSKSEYAKSLPPSLIDLVEPQRHWASVILKDSVHPRAVAFDSALPNRLMIVSNSGYLYTYSIPSTGGHCRLESEFSLLEKPSEAIGAKIHKSSNLNQKPSPPPGIHPLVASQLLQATALTRSVSTGSPTKSPGITSRAVAQETASPIRQPNFNAATSIAPTQAAAPTNVSPLPAPIPAPVPAPVSVEAPVSTPPQPSPSSSVAPAPFSSSHSVSPSASVSLPVSSPSPLPQSSPTSQSHSHSHSASSAAALPLFHSNSSLQRESEHQNQSEQERARDHESEQEADQMAEIETAAEYAAEPEFQPSFPLEPDSPPIVESPALLPVAAAIPHDANEEDANAALMENFSSLQEREDEEVKAATPFTTTLFDLDSLDSRSLWTETEPEAATEPSAEAASDAEAEMKKSRSSNGSADEKSELKFPLSDFPVSSEGEDLTSSPDPHNGSEPEEASHQSQAEAGEFTSQKSKNKKKKKKGKGK